MSETTAPDQAAPIRSAPAQNPLPRAHPLAGAGCVRPYVNEQLNSRLPYPLPAGTWAVKWQAPLNERYPAVHVLEGADRVLVQTEVNWQLFTAAGKPLGGEFLGRSDVLLDPRRGLFHFADRDGMLAAYRLLDARRDHYFQPFGGSLFDRTFLVKRGRRMLLAGSERQRPDMVDMPDHSAVEMVDLGEPPVVQREYLTSAKEQAVVEYKAAALKAALNEETLALAMRDRIVFSDLRLGPGTAFRDSFYPFAVSMDEADRLYVVAGDRVPSALWLLTPRGERVYAYQFPADLAVAERPAIVGYDHRAYVTARQTVLAIGPDGKLEWQRPAGGVIGGAAITSNDWLLVAAGATLAAFDPRGQRRDLHSFTGERLATAPVLTAAGDILVATTGRLYRLGRR